MRSLSDLDFPVKGSDPSALGFPHRHDNGVTVKPPAFDCVSNLESKALIESDRSFVRGIHKPNHIFNTTHFKRVSKRLTNEIAPKALGIFHNNVHAAHFAYESIVRHSDSDVFSLHGPTSFTVWNIANRSEIFGKMKPKFTFEIIMQRGFTLIENHNGPPGCHI